MPTKDEVALVNGYPLTIQGFQSIQKILRTPSPRQAVWVGIASVALYQDALTRGLHLSEEQALTVVRYSIEDLSFLQASSALEILYPGLSPRLIAQKVKKDLDDLLSRSVVVKNPVDPSSFL